MDTALTWTEFEKTKMRVGRVVEVKPFPEAHNPAYIIRVDFGSHIGIKKTSAQLTERYAPEALIGKHIIGVVNFAPKQIGPILSEFLILGALNGNLGTAVLEVPTDVPLGSPVS